jgi:hypothetical protein
MVHTPSHRSASLHNRGAHTMCAEQLCLARGSARVPGTEVGYGTARCNAYIFAGAAAVGGHCIYRDLGSGVWEAKSHRSEFYYGLLQQSEFMRRWHAQLQGTKQEPARRTPHAARRVHGNFSVPTRCPDAAPRVSSVVTGRWARGCGNCNVWPILAVTFISAARKSVPSAGGDANPSTQATTSRGAPQHVDTNGRLSHQRSIRAHASGRCCAASQRTLERERDGDWRWRGAGVCRLAWRTRAGGDWAARAGRPNGEGCRPLLWGLECSVSGERRALGAHDRLRSAAQAGGGEATGSAARQTAQA